MRKSAKIIAAQSVARLAVAAGSAFAHASFSTSGTANSALLIGGIMSHAITGATLDSLV